MSKEAIEKEKKKLVEQIKKIQKPPNNIPRWVLIRRNNTMLMSIHNYYQKATHIICDLSKPQNELRKASENQVHPTRKGKITQ